VQTVLRFLKCFGESARIAGEGRNCAKKSFHINGYNRFITIIIDYKRVVYGFAHNAIRVHHKVREKEIGQ
jgi:hypothetical protein